MVVFEELDFFDDAVRFVEDAAFFDDDDGYCCRCDGKGYIVVCIDDICRNNGECFHGDGEMVCPDCKGGY